MTEEAIDKMKTSSGDVDLILVGGGAIIIPQEYLCNGRSDRIGDAAMWIVINVCYSG
jgi:hypothetical protein